MPPSVRPRSRALRSGLHVALPARGLGAAARAQAPLGTPDPDSLTRPQSFSAARASSNNADPDSNDDSWRPIAGETVTIADLPGPGVVTHIWLTVAANEYGWPRLLRLRIYYDGSPVPSVDCPVGDFFGVGQGFERPLNSLMVRNSSSGRSRNRYWPPDTMYFHCSMSTRSERSNGSVPERHRAEEVRALLERRAHRAIGTEGPSFPTHRTRCLRSAESSGLPCAWRFSC